MASELLTTVKLKSITNKNVGEILSDGGGLRGRVRLNRKGGLYIHFEYKYRDGSKYRTAKVGNYPEQSLAEIRTAHRQLKSTQSQGIDPVDARKAEKMANRLEQAKAEEEYQRELDRLAAEQVARRTLKDAILEWERLELKRRKDEGAETMRAINKDILPAIGEIPLVEVRRSTVVDVLFAVVERGSPVMANHLFASLRQFFNFAVAREWIDAHPLAGLTRDKIGGREQTRERYLSQNEIFELKQAIPQANLLHTTEHAIWIMLATCCRVGELSKARWEHFDLESSQWLIPATNSKNGRDHTIYLSEFASQQFQKLKAITGYTDWCIPARDGENHVCLKSISKQIRDRTRDAPLSNRTKATQSLILSGGPWTPHDLRRTGATLMGELGVMGEVIERCLNHVEQNKLKRTYQRHELKAEQREAWRLLGDRLALLHSSEQNENLVVGQFRQSSR
jgi:integrase